MLNFVKKKLDKFIIYLEYIYNRLIQFLQLNLKEERIYLIFFFRISITYSFMFIYYILYVVLLFLLSLKYLKTKDQNYFSYLKDFL